MPMPRKNDTALDARQLLGYTPSMTSGFVAPEIVMVVVDFAEQINAALKRKTALVTRQI